MNSTSQTLNIFENSESLGALAILARDLVVPILVAVAAYVIVNQLGEWRKRRMFSRLGVVIIESLDEELRTGIRLMRDALAATEDKSAQGPPRGLLPTKSWSGMSTIPNEVLLRIVECSEGRSFEDKEFSPRQCLSHCKNYFDHMSATYEEVIDHLIKQAEQGEEWRPELINLLVGGGPQSFLQSATNVKRMLENARLLLDENSRRRMPK